MSNTIPANIGDTISFRSKHAHDNVLYKGKLLAIVSYPIAKSYTDLISYHNSVRKVDPDIDELSILNYFIVELDTTTSDKPKTRAFAYEWIEDGSFTIIDEAESKTLKIYNITDANMKDLVDSLKSQGYIVVQT